MKLLNNISQNIQNDLSKNQYILSPIKVNTENLVVFSCNHFFTGQEYVKAVNEFSEKVEVFCYENKFKNIEFFDRFENEKEDQFSKLFKENPEMFIRTIMIKIIEADFKDNFYQSSCPNCVYTYFVNEKKNKNIDF
jgi:hypothetical protein